MLTFTSEREVVDRDLNRRIAAHEEEALGELYDRYGLLFYSFVVRLLRSADDAEQLVHDHFISFWSTPQRYPEGRGTLYSQLVYSLRTLVVGRLTGKGQRRAVHGPDATVPLLVPDHTGLVRIPSAIDDATVNSLVTAVWSLPAEQQRLLATGWFDGFRVSEISERFLTTPDRVISSLHEAISVITALFVDLSPEKTAGHPARYDSLSTVFALDLLDGNPRRDLEAHLRSGCMRCTDSIAVAKEIGGILPAVLPQVKPAADLREKILFSARLSKVAKSQFAPADKTGVAPPQTAGGPEIITAKHVPDQLGKFFRTAGMIFAGIIIAGMAFYINSLHTVINEKEEYEKTLETKIFMEKRGAGETDGYGDILGAPHLSVLQLYGLGSRIIETGRVFWSPDIRSVIISSASLPPLSSGHSYRLWFVRNKELHPGPELACTADPKDGSYTSYQRIGLPTPIGDISAVEVTRETPGDTTGKIVLFGKF